MKIEFDPSSYKDASFILKAIQDLCPSSLQAFSSTNDVSPKKGGDIYIQLEKDNREKEEKIKNLELQINQIKKTNDEKENAIQSQKKEIETCQLEIRNLNKKLDEEKELNKFAQDELGTKENEFNGILAAKDAEFRKLQRELNNENLNLKNKIKELQKQIEQYVPSLEGASGDIKYFQVEGNKLLETNSDDAYYKAQVGLDRVCIFQFNCEKGHSKEACSKKDSLLLPFCDIIDENPDANNIAPGKWGEAIITDSGELDVKLKAQIRLVKI